MPKLDQALAARSADSHWLAAALQASRDDTLATFAAFERGAGGLNVPLRETLNPPLWELGHVGWFAAHWTTHNPACGGARQAQIEAQADVLYDSSHVPHDSRWALPLPDAAGTRAALTQQLQATLALLESAGLGDDALYFFRLALLHEDMHHEAALYSAQQLGVLVDDARWRPTPQRSACAQLGFVAGGWQLGSAPGGFAFDNELSAHPVAVPSTQIDARVVTWGEYLPFVEAGGYTQAAWWSDEGAAWLAAQPDPVPRYLRRIAGGWQHWRNGQWQALDLQLAACHLSGFEAQAFCRWAKRRLPTEAEWERAAIERPGGFDWGEVWEWTASRFEPYPGFEPHAYRDYSAPWFGSRWVLRGASFMTQPRLRHPRYRNFFQPDRNDVAAGFRTCRL